MGRWTQFDEDSTRLPEGVKRTGYDQDTARYTFCDQEGNIYLGPPHEEYGSLTLVGKSSRPPSSHDDRPYAFASDSKPELSVDVPHSAGSATFHDILPAHLITSPSSAESTLEDSPVSDGSGISRFRSAVRRATGAPSMQNVVNTVRRSATTARKPRDQDGEKRGLLRSVSKASSKITRSNSSATTATMMSVDERGAKQ